MLTTEIYLIVFLWLQRLSKKTYPDPCQLHIASEALWILIGHVFVLHIHNISNIHMTCICIYIHIIIQIVCIHIHATCIHTISIIHIYIQNHDILCICLHYCVNDYNNCCSGRFSRQPLAPAFIERPEAVEIHLFEALDGGTVERYRMGR